jgi:hypothetical protein
LQQIAGLGALFASSAGGTSPFKGFQDALNKYLSNPSSPDNSGIGNIISIDPTYNTEGSVQTEDGLGSV